MARIGVTDWKKFEKFLLAHGCEFTRETGDHRIYWKKDLKRPIVIPRDKLPPMLVLNNLRTLGVSREAYLAFFSKK